MIEDQATAECADLSNEPPTHFARSTDADKRRINVRIIKNFFVCGMSAGVGG
jgi:hypothetical protein